MILHRATREEASYYLRTRAAQGYTVIQTVLLTEFDGMRIPSDWGELPLVNLDPLQPNPAYFHRVAEFIEEADSLGLYVALVAVWGDKLTAPWGTGPRIFTAENLPLARKFGGWLGQRFAQHSNLIWLLGGDRPARLGGHRDNWCGPIAKEAGFPANMDWTTIWRELALGLHEGSGGQALTSYHPQGGEASTSIYLHGESWLHIHGMQSGHGGGHDQPVWNWVARDWALTGPKPTLDLEPNYEDHPYNPWPKWDPATGYFRDHDVRKQCYRSVFAGACGVTYGHNSVWQWCGPRHEAINFADRDWVDALHRPAGRQMGYLRQLMESRPQFTRQPDQSLIAGETGTGGQHLQATRDEAGTYAMVYFPANDLNATLKLNRLKSAKLNAWWYDPRTGFAASLGDIPGGIQREFRSPPYGPDWVLVLDDSNAGYPPPGSGVFHA